MQNSSRHGNRYPIGQRQEILQAYQRTQLSQRDFARKVGVGLSTLQYWLRKAGRASPSARPSFVEVPNPLQQSVNPARYRVQWQQGIALEVGSGFVPEEVAALLRMLASV